MKVLILGGNGFLGSKIAKHAILRGWQVVSASRSGAPKVEGKLANWQTEVEYYKWDPLVTQPPTQLFEKVDHIIHCIGAISTLPYKQLLSSPKNLLNSNNSTSNLNFNSNTSSLIDINFKTLQNLVNYLLKKDLNNLKSLSYISATPFLPECLIQDYLNSKRAAEQWLFTHQDLNHLDRMVFRPGLMTSWERPITNAIGLALITQSKIDSEVALPLQVEHVAQAIIEAINQRNLNNFNDVKKVRQIFTIQDIQKLVH